MEESKEKKKVNRKRLNVDLHIEIKNKYNTCFYCGEELPFSRRTVDHVIALANGGSDTEDNLVVACIRCNSYKGSLSLDEFIKLTLEGYFTIENIVERKRKEIDKRLKVLLDADTKFYEIEIDINDVIVPLDLSMPKNSTIQKRKHLYEETGKFSRTTYVERVFDREGKAKYIIKQGLTNYIVSKEFGFETMLVYYYDRKDRIAYQKKLKNNKLNAKNKIVYN